MKEGRVHSIAEAQFPKNFESWNMCTLIRIFMDYVFEMFYYIDRYVNIYAWRKVSEV